MAALKGIHMDQKKLQRLLQTLTIWYESHARELPWRACVTPYRVWVSEIMLQQTRVEAVKPYFARFIEALPDIAALAQCEEERLLKLWEGLGYYNRVRNMQKAAQILTEQYGGEMPANYDTLLSLPGIGSYTAGAIASIAFGLPEPAVDGNVLRVLTRVFDDHSDIAKQSFKKQTESVLREAMRRICTSGPSAGMVNQALMELGATVCVPNGEPKCAECPWRKHCRAKQAGTAEALPVKTGKKPRRIEDRTILIIRDESRIVLCRRPEKGLLAGMYEFPNLEGHLTPEEAIEAVRGMHLSPLHIRQAQKAKHIFSHVEWHMEAYVVRVDTADPLPDDLLFVEIEEQRRSYPVPSAYAAYLRLIDGK